MGNTPTPEKDYTFRGWLAIVTLIVVLIAVSLIPPQTIGSVELRRANILSDLISFDNTTVANEEQALFDEEDFLIDMQQVAEKIDADTAVSPVQVSFEWLLRKDTLQRTKNIPDSTLLNPTLVRIEDFTTRDSSRLRAFYDTLLYTQRPVRIAVLGDSFIEGDILTADLREKMQLAYGGGGAGFAPMASPLTGFRRSIKTQSKGWTAYNIMQRKTAPAAMRDNFYISGWVCQPTAGALTRWESSDFRKQLDDCTTARIFFISPTGSHIEVMLNDTLRHEFTVEGTPMVRQLTVSAPHIYALSFKVLSGTEGFVGYGAVFEADGVVVDNYSVRSNNGQAMFWTNPSVNAQINALLGYDLVILQYGLNIMQTGVQNYTNYANQIEKMVTYINQCFPTAAVLVLGVSDRSVKTDAGYKPMDAIPYMLKHQRSAAENTGAAFWPTCDAMRSLGGMEQFVANGWAGKDFTHINYAGGRSVAWSLFDAINAGVREAHAEAEQKEAARIREQQQRAAQDSIRRHQATLRLLPDILSKIPNTPLQ